jgi:hypothetical protein
MTGTTPTTLLHTQNGFAAAASGWQRFMLTTPQSFPVASTRVVVLRIVTNGSTFPAHLDGIGENSGRSYIDADGVGAFNSAIGDLAQTALLGKSQSAVVYANFAFTGTELGTQPNPYNSFAEALDGVLDAGLINLNGTSADVQSGWTGTLERPMTITASPAGVVRIGVTGGGS